MVSSDLALGQALLGRDSVDEVIAAMTLEEKINTVIGVGMVIQGLPLDSELRGPDVDRPPQKVPGAAGDSYAIERLGIPSMVLADGPAGLRIQPQREGQTGSWYATAFPIATLLASTWDTDLVESVGRATGNEVREYGVDILLAPALNIHRYPLGGRNFEYYSEDPLISGKMAAAMVRGVQSQGVGTSLKHFVANNHEWNRYVINVQVDQRALREIYLRGFEIAVREARPWTIMTSYNRLNGSYTSESEDLVTGIVRDQWGFDGFVMTDWFGGSDAVAQMKAGNDMLMPGTLVQQNALRAAIETGELDEAVLDRNIRHILGIVQRSPVYNRLEYTDNPDLEAHAILARQAAADGMVLLKNENMSLPLPQGLNLALFGNSSYDVIIGGTGSGDVNEAYAVSLLQGLDDAGFTHDTALAEQYEVHIQESMANRPPADPFLMPPPLPEMLPEELSIYRAAQNSDAAILTIGRNSGEVADRTAENDFYLSDTEKQLIERVGAEFHANGKPVIVVLNIGGVIETASWRDQVDAILLAWQPGQEAGYAIADVLSGKVNPSGKLADTFSLRLEDYPAAENFPGVVLKAGSGEDTSIMSSDEAAEIEYRDGIMVGYRYFNTSKAEVAWPFGYGLSYTDFVYEGAMLSSDRFADEITVQVTVSNSGQLAGREVVQLYLSAPEGRLDKPTSELRAFAKTALLEPGQSQVLDFTLSRRDLSSFDPDRNVWLAEPGSYEVLIGASSRDIRQQLAFTLEGELVTDP